MLICADRIGRGCEYTLIAPPASPPVRYSLGIDAKLPAPLSLSHCDAVQRHMASGRSWPTVDVLVCLSRPAAVVLAVWAIVINTIKSVPFWAFSHVLRKLPKIKPRGIYGYPATTIKTVFMIIWIIAPRLHGSPCGVQWMGSLKWGVLRHGKDYNQFCGVAQ